MLRCARDEEQRSITFQRSDDEDEEQRGEEERHGEEAENAGEEVENVSEEEEGEEAELERVSRQTQRSHVVGPPIALAQEEDRVLIRTLGDR
jgi:hypothetical protein